MGKHLANANLKTPIIFFIFNRPDTTLKVFNEIAKVKPRKLLVVADGPRKNRLGENKNCELTRALISQVDWECEVITNYSDQNLGCKGRLVSGLKWAFDLVEEAIILEDDCLPDVSFFPFCEEMLEKYRNDSRVLMVCGTNLANSLDLDASYYYSRYPHIWGWATWRRTIEAYDPDMTDLEALLEAKHFIESFDKREYEHWKKCFLDVYSGKINTWDAQITYLAFITSSYSVVPKVNLIKNIGFGDEATHTFDKQNNLANLATFSLSFPLKYPKFFISNIKYDAERKLKEKIGISFIEKIKSKLISLG